MKKSTKIAEVGNVCWYALSRDPDKPDCLIDTNEYVVATPGEALLTDPGGMEIFPAVFRAVSEVIDPGTIRQIFASHQDPDVISSLALWLAFNPEIRCHVSGLWKSFIPHFGGTDSHIAGIPDDGGELQVGQHTLNAIPAHYLHSSGNFHLYDANARLLFSGDIGAALLPNPGEDLFVRDFDRHIRFAEGFHKRWLGSNTAKRVWCERVSGLQIDLLCPQHGSIYQGADVMRFINWLDELKVGIC
ncbi:MULTISPECIES: MBL fold metallo-hydrolase [unclassified Paludibacterium]|uniref:MBL fold metallo-hydrolase n=1 Tax=unclassified Paludibacterium TaxID=2618429 RepID=UPI001C04A8BD|nr:MBL fold metallo-hydrolase [Paludibacterium sp. B53371]BEV71638.1 MBL fold metallo-hydrolase [Paludibacterium sp. THUN1379]